MQRLQAWDQAEEAARGDRPVPRMFEDDAHNFLRLATVLKVILARSVREGHLMPMQQLLEEYFLVFAQVRLAFAALSND